MEDHRRKIVAIDFDGTIAQRIQFAGIGVYGDILPGAAAALQQLKKAGWKIIIFTARNHDDRTIMRHWLAQHDVPFDELTNRKPPEAHVMLDDRSLNFGGDWSTALFDILAFEPYYFQGDTLSDSGSGKGNSIILVPRVFKEATDDKMEKLLDEIGWLRSLPEQWKEYFPEIILSGFDLRRAYFEMPDYNLPTLRRLIINGTLEPDEVLDWTKRILDLSFEMYRSEMIPHPYGYMARMYFERVDRRLHEAAAKSLVLAKLIEAPTIKINGKRYRNIQEIVTDLWKCSAMFLPEYVSRWGHSDLHFSNFLIDQVNKKFRLIDPRGHRTMDYYYDFGKLLHSTLGKYEMLAEGLFDLEETRHGIEFCYHKGHPAYGILNKVNAKLPDLLDQYSGEPYDVMMMKSEFANAMHFAAIAPFLMEFDGVEKKAIAGFCLGVIFCQEVVDKYL